ncbi:MAG: hypothetical protein K2F81_09655, partial [Ruminococcus sp.]|nr:hypothetical protein [Ruminococcus sp.]
RDLHSTSRRQRQRGIRDREKAEEIAPLPDNDTSQGNSNSTEKNEENTRQGEIKSTEIKENHSLKYIITIITALISATLLAFILRCIVKRLKLFKRLKSFDRLDNKTSVITTFTYVINLLKATKYLENENQLYISEATLYNKIDNLSELLKSSLIIYEKAKFSNHEISDDEKCVVLSLLSKTTEKIKSENTVIKNITTTYVPRL